MTCGRGVHIVKKKSDRPDINYSEKIMKNFPVMFKNNEQQN